MSAVIIPPSSDRTALHAPLSLLSAVATQPRRSIRPRPQRRFGRSGTQRLCPVFPLGADREAMARGPAADGRNRWRRVAAASVSQTRWHRTARAPMHPVRIPGMTPSAAPFTRLYILMVKFASFRRNPYIVRGSHPYPDGLHVTRPTFCCCPNLGRTVAARADNGTTGDLRLPVSDVEFERDSGRDGAQPAQSLLKPRTSAREHRERALTCRGKALRNHDVDC